MPAAYEQQVAQAPSAAAPPAHAEAAAQASSSGGGGLFDRIGHLASSGLGAIEHAGSTVASRLSGGVDESRGPALNPFWNHLFGGPNEQAGDGRPLTQNHIGTQKPGPAQEGGPISDAMRNVPYLGDYWESLSVTHDSAHIHNNLLNGLTAVTDVALPGPVMGLVDAPFRAAGTSLFLDKDSLAKK